MSDIVLSTMNARYIHAAFGLRYLKANLGTLAEHCAIREFGIKERPMDVVEALLAEQPRIVGLGVYIWNVAPLTEVAALLKRLSPEIYLVLGGPEVSFETEAQAIVALADVVITGEADLAFADLCHGLLKGNAPQEKIINAPPPDMNHVALPYHLYSDEDLAHRHIYVEASRGCPYTCEFCLSSLDIPVRRPELTAFLSAMEDLLNRGARHFKFVDRTFNLNTRLTRAILEFFLERYMDGLFLHFEMVPDRLPEAIRDLIVRFPEGSLQFEIGIQTFNAEVATRISLHRDHRKTEDNLDWLHGETGVHVHADLIAGLPGEDLSSFGDGFDRLLSMRPAEIQVGILKRLRGTPIIRHEESFVLRFNPYPPYEILSTLHLNHVELQRLRRFAQLWDRAGNSGSFTKVLPRLWQGASPFWSFMAWSEWVTEEAGRSHSLSADRLARLLFRYLVEEKQKHSVEVARDMRDDFLRLNRPVPPWLAGELNTASELKGRLPGKKDRSGTPNTKRQRRVTA